MAAMTHHDIQNLQPYDHGSFIVPLQIEGFGSQFLDPPHRRFNQAAVVVALSSYPPGHISQPRNSRAAARASVMPM